MCFIQNKYQITFCLMYSVIGGQSRGKASCITVSVLHNYKSRFKHLPAVLQLSVTTYHLVGCGAHATWKLQGILDHIRKPYMTFLATSHPECLAAFGLNQLYGPHHSLELLHFGAQSESWPSGHDTTTVDEMGFSGEKFEICCPRQYSWRLGLIRPPGVALSSTQLERPIKTSI